jgi:ligand-binding sensor domain-containing protein
MKQLAIFLLFVFISVFGFSQSHIRFKNFSITSGLSQSVVNCIVQDDVGFIWIGTQDGLNKFDGYRFQIYNKDRIKNLESNYFYSSYKDHQGVLWFGTQKSVLRYDAKTDRFKAFPVPAEFLKENSFVGSITENVNGEILFHIENSGIFKFNREKEIFQKVSNSFSDPS